MWYNPADSKVMETQDEAPSKKAYEPSAEQLRRASRLRGINLLYVYVPLALVVAVYVGLIVAMLIKAIGQSDENGLRLISGLADAALILAMLPMLIFGAAVLGGIGYAYGRAKKAGTAPVATTQRLFWRLESQIVRARVRALVVFSTAVKPVLSLNSAISYARELVAQLVGMLKRS
jgi:hypothetical protein